MNITSWLDGLADSEGRILLACYDCEDKESLISIVAGLDSRIPPITLLYGDPYGKDKGVPVPVLPIGQQELWGEGQLEFEYGDYSSLEPKCDCGVEILGYTKHSDWCSKYVKEQE